MTNTLEEIQNKITQPVTGYRVGGLYFIGKNMAIKESKKSGLDIERVVFQPTGGWNGRYNR